MKMERQKLDNGLLLIAYLSNIFAPFGIMIYFGIKYLSDPLQEENLIFTFILSLFTLFSLLMFVRFRKVEFDDQYVYVKNVFNKEIDSFPVKNIRSVKKMMLSFNGKHSRKGSGKNYRITYLNNDGAEKKVRVMATIGQNEVNNFIQLTSFLGTDGFNPE
jgi:hypothetical protein